MKKRYIYIELEETNGEHTYYHRSVHSKKMSDESILQKVERFGKNHAKDFWCGDGGGEYDKELGGWWFYCGEIFIHINKCYLISEEEYNVLNTHL